MSGPSSKFSIHLEFALYLHSPSGAVSLAPPNGTDDLVFNCKHHSYFRIILLINSLLFAMFN